jgi:hypothetical protein
MTDPQIVPEKITKPLQLLAAWLAGLVVVNGSFLGTAVAIVQPEWLRAALVLASIVNVPLFLTCLFLLQTKFRPEMQEDRYYAKYLEQNTGQLISITPTESAIESVRAEILEANQRQFAMISGLEAGLKAMAIQMSNGTGLKAESASRDAEVKRVVREVQRSSEALEVAKARAEAQVSVQLNDMLPEFKEIRSELRIEGVELGNTFGHTAKEPEIPRVRVIGFGSAASLDALRRVMRATARFGFDHIHYASDRKGNEEVIYVGSYIYRTRESELVKVSNELRQLIDDPEATFADVVQAVMNATPKAATAATRNAV